MPKNSLEVEIVYKVMQSVGNSFGRDVVLVSECADSILDQIYKNKYFGIFIVKILNFKSD